MKYWTMALAVTLAGCASKPVPVPEPTVVFKEVKVEVPVPCPVMVDPPPDYPDTDQNLMEARGHIDRQVSLLLAARSLRGPYEAELVAALKGCTER